MLTPHHLSHIMCHVSGVTCHFSSGELVSRGSVINEAYPVQFFLQLQLSLTKFPRLLATPIGPTTRTHPISQISSFHLSCDPCLKKGAAGIQHSLLLSHQLELHKNKISKYNLKVHSIMQHCPFIPVLSNIRKKYLIYPKINQKNIIYAYNFTTKDL